MNYAKVEIEVPADMVPYVKRKDPETANRMNALMLYPYICDETISYGKAAEILGFKKMDLIVMYGNMGLSYFNEEIDEVLRDAEKSKTARTGKESAG